MLQLRVLMPQLDWRSCMVQPRSRRVKKKKNPLSTTSLALWPARDILSFRISLVAQMVKHLPVVREAWVQSQGCEDSLEREMATHSSTLAWKIPWMEEPGRLQSTGSQRVRHNWVTSLSFFQFLISEMNMIILFSHSFIHRYLLIFTAEMDYKESWVLKNWCFWTVVLEKTLESPLDCKEIKPVNPKGDQSWILIGRADAEAETPILWLPDVNNWLIGKAPDAGKDWRQEEKGTTEDEMVGWHHRLYGHEFEQVLGVGDGQGGLVCCSSWGHKELDTTERLNWTELSSTRHWAGNSTVSISDRVWWHFWGERDSYTTIL